MSTLKISEAAKKNTNTILMLPISVLEVSSLNVRKTQAKKADDEEMQASILDVGIIQNLVSLPLNDSGKYEIVSGGRRLSNTMALVRNGELPKDFELPVRILSNKEAEAFATQISLTENVMRSEMHPVDEFHAYSKMVNDGNSIDAVAQKFGKTKLYVKQRMKLANVAPEILQAFRDGNITLEKVMIFTIASPERQSSVWKSTRQCSYMVNDSKLRHMLKEQAVEEDSKVAKLVGRAEYEERGGRISSDLFSEKVYFEDVDLLEKIAKEKMQVHADELLSKGWKWVECKIDHMWGDTTGYKELNHNKGKYKKKEMELAGCIVFISWNGKVELMKGLVAKEDQRAFRLLNESESKTNNTDLSESKTYSNALREDLKAHRLVMGQHSLMKQHELALDTLHFSVCLKVLGTFECGPLDLNLNRSWIEPKVGSFNENKAAERMEALKQSFDLSWLEPVEIADMFTAFVKMNVQEKQKQVAYATSLALRPSLSGEDGMYNSEFVYGLLDLNCADYWRPSHESFLKRIGVRELIDIAKPVMSKEWVSSATSLKKADLAKQIEIWLDGKDDSLTEKQKKHFAQWMPTGF